MTDYPDIYLQPACCADPLDGRMWCADPDPEMCDSCDKPVKWLHYVRADSFETLQEENAQLQAQIDQVGERAKNLPLAWKSVGTDINAMFDKDGKFIEGDK